MNSLGDASKLSPEDVLRFDYLMIVDTGNVDSYSAAVVEKKDIRKQWLDFKKDGVTLKMPTDELTFVIRPDDINLDTTEIPKSYKQFKNEAQRKFLEQFKN